MAPDKGPLFLRPDSIVVFLGMKPTVRDSLSEGTYKALQQDLRRRIEVVAHYDTSTFGHLAPWELALLVTLGIGFPLALAWWML